MGKFSYFLFEMSVYLWLRHKFIAIPFIASFPRIWSKISLWKSKGFRGKKPEKNPHSSRTKLTYPPTVMYYTSKLLKFAIQLVKAGLIKWIISQYLSNPLNTRRVIATVTNRDRCRENVCVYIYQLVTVLSFLLLPIYKCLIRALHMYK